jgi:cytochrome b561
MALLILIALVLGVWLPRGELRSEVLFVHKSFGVTILALVVLRIVVRLIVGAPAYAAPLRKFMHAAAGAAPLALYALMVAMPVSGTCCGAPAGRVCLGSAYLPFPTLFRRTEVSPGPRTRRITYSLG